MISVLSFIIAVLLTIVVALILYPIAAIFWIFGLIGKLSEHTFKLTTKIISYLWKDLRKASKRLEAPIQESDDDSEE